LPEQTNKVSSRDTDSELGVDLKEVALAGQSHNTQGVEQSTDSSAAGDDGCRSPVTTAEHPSYASMASRKPKKVVECKDVKKTGTTASTINLSPETREWGKTTETCRQIAVSPLSTQQRNTEHTLPVQESIR